MSVQSLTVFLAGSKLAGSKLPACSKGGHRARAIGLKDGERHNPNLQAVVYSNHFYSS